MAKPQHSLPVAKGDRLELEVETQGASGDGICRHEGYTLFLPDALPGDRVLAEIEKTTPRFGVARVAEMRTPSPHRIEPPCPVFAHCGGCKLQHFAYEQQIKFKQQVVLDALERIGKIAPPRNIETVPAARAYGYRNKASFAVAGNAGAPLLGFFAEGTHAVADSPTCDILHPAINEAKEWIRLLLAKHRISLYDEKKHKGFLRGLMIRHSERTKDTLVGLVTAKGKFPGPFFNDLKNPEFLKRFQVTGIVQNLNDKNTNVILGERSRALWGKNAFTERLDDLTFQLSLGSFFQVNTEQTERLYELLQRWLLPGEGAVLDAYCGSGAIALWLANKGRRVIGIEEFAPAVADAKASAALNGISNCEFVKGTVETVLPALPEDDTPETVIVDPPRKGCSETALNAILRLAPRQILYVSCNPATLARDLAHLKGYQIERLAVVDLFPQTQHVETLVSLIRE